MIIPRRIALVASRQNVRAFQTFASSPSSQYGRTAAYRRLRALSRRQAILRSYDGSSLRQPLHILPFGASRSLHSSYILAQQAQAKKEPPEEEVRDPPRQPEETPAQEAKTDEQKSEDQKPEGEEGKSEEGEKKDGKDAPPPPPHGDKTPWQVFRETFSTELKASKEWNESTKQLAGEVQDFRDSEGVKKASAAYDATVGRAGRGASAAAKAVGTGAAWTWETPVVQGIRKGVNATGRGIEQVTRPVRESQTFKDVSDAIDDGSSARYGGFIEKEERRSRRLKREAKDGIHRLEKMEEDPKWVLLHPIF